MPAKSTNTEMPSHKKRTKYSGKQIESLIDSAMLQLEKDDYEILYELFFKHTSVHKLADNLGITCPTIRYRRDRALKRLKEIIELYL